MEVGKFKRLLGGVSDLGAYGAALALTRTFYVVGCDHLRVLGKPPHKFPSVDDIRESVQDALCKNVVSRFLKRFCVKGGRALATAIGTVGTREVFWGFWFLFWYIVFCFIC